MLAAVLAVLLLCACGGQPSREPNPPEPPEEAPYEFTLDYHRCAPLVEKKIGSDLVAAARLVIDAFLAGETSVTLPEGDYGGNPGNDLGYALNSMCPAFGAVTDYDDYHFDTETCTVTWAYTQTPEQVREVLARTLQREPTVSEISAELGVEREEVVLALESIQEPISLYEPVFHDDGDAIYVMDQVADTKNTDARWIENIALSEAMKKLTPRERKILNMRFFEGKTQMEVAEEISISQAQVSRLEKNALKYMRKYV